MVELIFFPEQGGLFQCILKDAAFKTVEDVLLFSKVYEHHPDARYCAVGIFGQTVSLGTIVKEGDRIELYRPLIKDPKIRRRQYALSQRRLRDQRNKA